MFDAVLLRILLVTLAGWVNRNQLEVIEYLREENRVLKEHLGGRRLRLTDVQRRRLAMNGHRLGPTNGPRDGLYGALYPLGPMWDITAPFRRSGRTRRRPRLGGLPNYYERAA
jgi:hypothetical protein